MVELYIMEVKKNLCVPISNLHGLESGAWNNTQLNIKNTPRNIRLGNRKCIDQRTFCTRISSMYCNTSELQNSFWQKQDRDLANWSIEVQETSRLEEDGAWKEWLRLVSELPSVIKSKDVRHQIETLPEVDVTKMEECLKWRAMQIISFVAHAYVWSTSVPAKTLPSNVAVPWCQLGRSLEMPPVLTYSSYMLLNWYPSSGTKWEPDGMKCRYSFTGTQDEEWFIAVHASTEAKGRGAVVSVERACMAVSEGDFEGAKVAIDDVAEALRKMTGSMLRMPEQCRPEVFKSSIRPFLEGWKNSKHLPNGLIYHGMAENVNPLSFYGPSGVQSHLVHLLDSFLRVHPPAPPYQSYLQEIQQYMPKEHREMVRRAREGPNIRKMIWEDKNGGCRKAYDECVKELLSFRKSHMVMIKKYISEGVGKQTTVQGTAGTDAFQYLQGNVLSTRRCIIDG